MEKYGLIYMVNKPLQDFLKIFFVCVLFFSFLSFFYLINSARDEKVEELQSSRLLLIITNLQHFIN